MPDTIPARSTPDGTASSPDPGAVGHIAVIGMAGRFPGARHIDEFWQNLLDGKDSITRVGDGEAVAARGLLDDPEVFDAEYFGIPPAVARVINPQQRLFLQCAVEALENAGHDPVRHPGTVGVYAGGGENAYAQVLRSYLGVLPSLSEWEIRVGNGPDFLCSQVAHKLGLRGPAVTVQAGCATSLLAVHLAVQGLLAGDCDLALAGGVTVRVPAGIAVVDDVGLQAPDGYCRAFDASARGPVGADGVGLVVLRRLADAVADGDRIDAVLRGSAVNNDGANRLSFTAPSVKGQAAVIRKAQRAAGITPESCTYVEAHGTGTRLGDPIEIAALTSAFAADGGTAGRCGIGSVKTNIGHADAAAGIAGLIKTVLAVKHGVLPASLHFSVPNPQIDFDRTPFRVVADQQKWQPETGPRRAGVSAFSVGGTNAHVVLEEPPPVAPSGPPSSAAQVLVLSAKTPAALAAMTRRLADHLRAAPTTPLDHLSWTLQAGRTEHSHRAMAVVTGHDDAVAVLTGERPGLLLATGPVRSRPLTFRLPAVVDPPAGRAVWMALYRAHPAFRQAVDECRARAAFEDDTGSPVLLTFVGHYATAQLWRRWGAEPARVVGTGIGAMVAGALTGLIPAAEAADLVRQAAGGGETSRPGDAADHEHWTGILQQVTPADTTPPAQPAGDDITLEITAGTCPADERSVLDAIGRLWLSGAQITWSAMHAGHSPVRVAAPAYPFEGGRHILEPRETARPAVSGPEPGPDPAARVLSVVSGLFEEILGLAEVDPDDSFFDLGGDSLLAMRFVTRLNGYFPVGFAPRMLFAAPSAAAMTAAVEEHLAPGGPR
ncbi:beta-ketoacyl synthase N-terminal-like domain-containing protein [Actinoplanes sp. DH11]|uniref:beta-ketoacyl synthase N-terminal-like domain-containing protein n=1 Tax=Actinoplanes sp. DH11 TaxID=2857011 RepID=UPI001E39A836|nr:beta-ketoacyl synthase N-terminal-like domain-containing protein [Actinoplanes sp. DH11]